MENLELACAVDPGRFDQARMQRRLDVLSQEEHDERTGDRRHDQWDVSIQDSQVFTQFVESDESELTRHHHHDEHEDEQEVLSLECVKGESIRGQRREVSRQDRHEYGDDQAVLETGPDVDVIHHRPVVFHEGGTRDQCEPRQDRLIRPRRVDEHHEERDETDDRHHGQNDVDDAFGGAALLFFLCFLREVPRVRILHLFFELHFVFDCCFS